MITRITLIATLLLCASGTFAQQGDGGQWNLCRLDSIYQFTWDTIAQNWTPQSKIIRTHNNDRYLTNSNVQPWNGSEYGNVSQKDTFSYDANSNFVNDIMQIWNGSDWLIYQAIYSYNANNQRTSMLYQRLNGAVWEDLQQNFYSYDGNGYLTTQITQTWNGSQWQNASKGTYTNNANGKPVNLLYQSWNGTDWVNSTQFVWTYDANGFLSVRIMQMWNSTQWADYYKEVHTNNSYGFNTEIIKQMWNGTEYVNNGKEVHYHTCTGTSGIENLSEKIVSVYPNPFTDKLTIEPNISYQLFDLIGREMDKTSLPVLPVGTYILKTEFGAIRVVKE